MLIALKKSLVIVLLFFAFVFPAQKQANMWFFGIQSGLNFNGGSPLVISGGRTSTDLSLGEVQEGTSSISDSSGALLFYTSGKTIWNRLHQTMLNGTGLMGGNSSTQAALIVPRPGSDSIFYVFTSDEFQNFQTTPQKGYRYSVVNMCLGNGNGAVVSGMKNIFLADSSTEKLSACRDNAGTGYWIVGHKMFSNKFMAWHLTSAGITSTVMSSIGSIHGWNPYNSTWWGAGPAQGQMKLNPAGTKLALAIGNFQPAVLDLFDFNNTNGQVTNPCHIVIDSAQFKSAYGVEFSADGTKLYVTLTGGMAPNQKVYQYDLLSGGGSCSAVRSSAVLIHQSNTNGLMYGMQIAPDNKIYLTLSSSSNLACINSPNLAGASCSFVASAITHTALNNFYALPSFIAGFSYSNGIAPCCDQITVSIASSTSTLCSGESLTLTASGAMTYTWSGSAIGTNISISPTITTTYSVTGTTAGGCLRGTSKTITVSPLPLLSLSSGSICSGQSFTIAASGASSYTYLNGSAVVSPTANTVYTVIGTSSAGCISTSALSNITVFPLPLISGNSGTICSGQSFTIIPTGAVSYSFQGNSAVLSPSTTSTFTFIGWSPQGCLSQNVAASVVSVIPLPTITVNSGSICSGNSFTISPSGASSYTFSGGSNVVTPTVSSTYFVTGTSSMGCASSNTAVLSVTVWPSPSLTVNNGSICSGGIFTISPQGAFTYTVSGSSLTVSPQTNATFSVSGTSAQGCVAANVAISSVSVFALPIVTISPVSAICSGASVTLFAGGASSYVWNNSANTNSITVQPQTTSAYTVTGTDYNGCFSTDSIIVTVFPLPLIIVSSARSFLCSGESTTLTASGAGSYTWSLGQVSSSLIVQPSSTTTYTTVGKDQNGCLASLAFSLLVNECLHINANNNFTNSILLFPNPGDGQLSFKAEETGDYTLIIFGIDGQRLRNYNITKEIYQFNLGLEFGVYHYRVLRGELIVDVGKIIINR